MHFRFGKHKQEENSCSLSAAGLQCSDAAVQRCS